MEIRAGTRVDRYVLVEQLGEGGQGAVWKATDPLQPERPCALKLVPVVLARPEDVERARREARALARLDHPSLVKCHGLFEDLSLGVLGIAMELVEGDSLRRLLADPRLSAPRKEQVLTHLARVLAYLHEHGVVHRDVKLDNVLVRGQFWEHPEDPTTVKLVDLGIANVAGAGQQLTAVGTVIGTLPYLAPELVDPAAIDGEPTSPRIDVFAFGVLGWLLLAERHPTGLGASAKLSDFARVYRAALDNPAWLEATPSGPWGQVLEDCLAVRPARRIRDGLELLARAGAQGDRVVVSSGARGPVDVSAPTAVDGVARVPAPAAVTGEASAPRAAGGKGSWLVGLTLLGAVAVGVAVSHFGNKSAPPAPIRPAPVPAAAASRRAAPDAAPSGPDATAAADAVAAGADADCAQGTEPCPCCPSGRVCGPPSCDALLEVDEGFRLRPGAALLSDGADLLTTHPQAELCLSIGGDAGKEICTALAETADGGVPKNGLYATVPDLLGRGLDVVIRAPVLGVGDAETRAVLASREGVAFGSGIRRRALCHGLKLDSLTTDLPIASVVVYLDSDDDAAVRRCR